MTIRGGGHSHVLFHHGHSPLHRLPAHVKIVSLLSFVLVVVLTPREQFWLFATYAALLVGVAAVAKVSAGFIVKRMVVEVPFVVFALLMPFIATGDRVSVLGLSVSEDGLLSGWTILAKGTLGVVSAILLAATTEPRALLVGLQRLRLPAPLVEIMAFMVRYADVIGGEMERMRVARESRGFAGRNVGQLRVLARTSGSLFIRSYERGERVYLAMQSRGYAGAMPLADTTPATGSAWLAAAVLPVTAGVLLAAAVLA